MKKYNLYAIDLSKNFKNYDCLVCASSKTEAIEIAQNEMQHTRLNSTHVKEILLEQAKVFLLQRPMA